MTLPGWISGLLRGSAPVEFESSFGLSESVERLRAASRRFVFSALDAEAAVGAVSESRVSLQRIIPMWGNSFKPFFRGRFVERNGKVFLVGRFTMYWLVKLFMAVWFSFVGFFIIYTTTLVALRPQRVSPAAPLAGFVMIVAGAGLVSAGKLLARNDAAWLSDVIRRALCGPILDHPAHSGQETTAIPFVAAMLGLGGLICWMAALFDIQSASTGPKGLVITYFTATVSRYSAAVFGTALLISAYGVYRRSLLAWRSFFAFLVGGWLYSVAEILVIQNRRLDHGMAIIFGVASLLVMMVWIRWWYAQRRHFQD